MKYSQNVYDVLFFAQQVRYAIVTIQQNSYFPFTFNTMNIADLRELA
nr:hypothetical protein [Syntrophorhabdus aromaticivorans]